MNLRFSLIEERPPRLRVLRLALSLFVVLGLVPLQALAFGYEQVVEKARAAAHEPYKPMREVPEFLAEIKYDAHRDIRFKPDQALWRSKGMNFDVYLLHPGFLFKHPVRINIFDAEGVHELPFRTELFDYGKNDFADRIPKDLGYAGLVINYPIKNPDVQDQVVVFQGASYFRSLGRDNVYGLSARGLAIDTGLPSGEEFPYFTEFWLERPSPRQHVMKVYALLDSPSVTGAYRFTIVPGEETWIHVKATVFERKRVKELGIAPLTSMFLYGENGPRLQGDWRPEIHDSDGLLMHNGTGEWIWRPLENKLRLRISMFSLQSPRGFGLLQRDREFVHYEDLETHQDLRPGLWIRPDGDWGEGAVKLAEIPSDEEYNDNIVAYWVPADRPEPGEPMTFNYIMGWGFNEPSPRDAGRVTGTWVGYGGVKGKDESKRRFVIDFQGEDLAALGPEARVEGVVSVGEGAKLLEQQVHKNTKTGGWRLVFQIKLPEDRKPVDLRAFLKSGETTMSETWTYLFES